MANIIIHKCHWHGSNCTFMNLTQVACLFLTHSKNQGINMFFPLRCDKVCLIANLNVTGNFCNFSSWWICLSEELQVMYQIHVSENVVINQPKQYIYIYHQSNFGSHYATKIFSIKKSKDCNHDIYLVRFWLNNSQQQ